MAVIKFPRVFREPRPPEREQLELWDDLPEPPKRHTPEALLAEIADELAAAAEYLDAARVGLALLQEHDHEDEPS
jgi:hypothetical protein